MTTLLDGASIKIQNNNGKAEVYTEGSGIVVRSHAGFTSALTATGIAKAQATVSVLSSNNDLIVVAPPQEDTTSYTIASGDGADIVQIYSGNVAAIDTGAGNDVITVAGGIVNKINTGAGNDIVQAKNIADATITNDSGNDTLNVVNSTRVTINGGSSADIINIRGEAGDNNIVYGNAGNDILTVSAGKGHKLVGGAGNDKYVISHLVNNGSYVIDQTSAGAKDRDTLSLAGYRAFDNQGNCNYSIENSNGNTILHYNNGETKADINILGNATNPLSSVIFADKTLRKADLLPSTIQVECSGYMSYDSTNENNIFNIHPDFEGWNNFSLNIKGFTASDKLVFAASAEEMSNYSVNFTCYNKSLSINFLDPEGSRFLGYITFEDFFDNNNSLDMLGNHYVFMGQREEYHYSGHETYVSRGDSFTATIYGATDNTNIDLTPLYLPDSTLNPDGISCTRRNNDLEMNFSVEAYFGQDYTIANSSLVLKDYFVNRPQVGFKFCEEDTKFTGLVLGDDNANIVNLDNLQPDLGEKGVFYAGLGGNDQITASTGINTIFGGAGADTITLNYTEGGANLVSGGLGNDTITVINSQVSGIFQGNDGDDIITVEAQNLQEHGWYDIFGGVGADEIDVNLTNCDNTIVNVYGGSGNDWITVIGGERAYITGGAGDDVITLDWNTINSTIISNDALDEEEDEPNATYGDKDRLIIKNASFADVDIEYDSTSSCLIIVEKSEGGNSDGYYYEGKHIRISGWNQVPFDSITFEKNGVKETFTTEQINAIFTGSTYNINSSTGIVEGTDKIDTYKLTGTGWNVAIDGIGKGDILDFSAYNEGNYLLKYSYDRDSNSFMLSYYQQGASPEAANRLIGNMVLVNPVLEYGEVNIITKTYANGGIQESHLSLNQYGYGQTLQALGNGVTLVCDDSSISDINTGNGNDTVYLNAGSQRVSTYGGSDTIHINSNNNSFIDAGNGEDSIYIRGNNNTIYGQGGNDNYYLYWNSSDSNKIFDYGYNNEVNTLTIYGISKGNLKFAEESSYSNELIISDATGRKLSINDWKISFSQGINFDDGILSVADIEANIANNKAEQSINDATYPGQVFVANDNKVDIYSFSGSGWLASVSGFDNEADLLDFTSYTQPNYMLKYTYGGENNHDLALELVRVADTGYINSLGNFIINDFLPNGTSWKSLSYNITSDGRTQSVNLSAIASSSVYTGYELLSSYNSSLLKITGDNEVIDLMSIRQNINLELNGNNDSGYLGSGNDTITINGNYGVIYAGHGDDSIYANGRRCTLYGEAGDDTYYLDWATLEYIVINDTGDPFFDVSENNRIVIDNVSSQTVNFYYDESQHKMEIRDETFLKQIIIYNWDEEANYEIYFSSDNTIFSKNEAEIKAEIGHYDPNNSEIITDFDYNTSLDLTQYRGSNVAFKSFASGDNAIVEIMDTSNAANTVVERIILKDALQGMAFGAQYNINVAYYKEAEGSYEEANMTLSAYYGTDKFDLKATSSTSIIDVNSNMGTIVGSDGSDCIRVNADQNNVSADDGDDVIYVSGRYNSINGGSGNDTFYVAWDNMVQTSISDYAPDAESLFTPSRIEIYATSISDLMLFKNGSNMKLTDGNNTLTVTNFANTAVGEISIVDISSASHSKVNYYMSTISDALQMFDSIALDNDFIVHYESTIDAATYNDTLNKLNITGNT